MLLVEQTGRWSTFLSLPPPSSGKNKKKKKKKREKLSLFVSELWTAGGDFCLKMAELKTLESIRIEAETKEKGDNGPTREKGL